MCGDRDGDRVGDRDGVTTETGNVSGDWDRKRDRVGDMLVMGTEMK